MSDTTDPSDLFPGLTRAQREALDGRPLSLAELFRRAQIGQSFFFPCTEPRFHSLCETARVYTWREQKTGRNFFAAKVWDDDNKVQGMRVWRFPPARDIPLRGKWRFHPDHKNLKAYELQSGVVLEAWSLAKIVESANASRSWYTPRISTPLESTPPALDLDIVRALQALKVGEYLEAPLRDRGRVKSTVRALSGTYDAIFDVKEKKENRCQFLRVLRTQ